MPLLLAAGDPARTDAKTGAAVSYVRVDFLHLEYSPTHGAVGHVKIGIYVDPAAATNLQPVVREREITLTPNQAQTVVGLVTDRIYQALSAPQGPFPNATIV